MNEMHNNRRPRAAGARIALALVIGLTLAVGASGAEETPRGPLTVQPPQLLGPPDTARVTEGVPPSSASDFHLKTVDIEGKAISLAELLRKGPVLLDFWALWCKPCLKELPELDRLQAKWGGHGLTVVAINTDAPVEVARVRPFVKTGRYRFRVVTDTSGELKRRFQINTLPTSLLLAPDGLILWSNQGYRPGDEKRLDEQLTGFFAGADSTN